MDNLTDVQLGLLSFLAAFAGVLGLLLAFWPSPHTTSSHQENHDHRR